MTISLPATCTIVGEFVGIRTEPCGQLATYAAVGRCDRGHTRNRPLCTHHAEVFQAFPSNVFCDQCDQVGVETPMTVGVEVSR